MEVEEPEKKDEPWAPPDGVPWSLYKKQQLDAKRKPSKGPAITTGFDISTAEERAKAASRLAKFDPEAAEKLQQEQKEKDESSSRRRGWRASAARIWGSTGRPGRASRPRRCGLEIVGRGTARRGRRKDGRRRAGDGEASASLPCDRNLFKKLRSHDLEGHFLGLRRVVRRMARRAVGQRLVPGRRQRAARAKMALAAEIRPTATWICELAFSENRKDQGRQVGQARHSGALPRAVWGICDVLTEKPKFANPDPTKRGKFKPPKKKRGRGKRKMNPERSSGASRGGLGASRGAAGRRSTWDSSPSAAAVSKPAAA